MVKREMAMVTVTGASSCADAGKQYNKRPTTTHSPVCPATYLSLCFVNLWILYRYFYTVLRVLLSTLVLQYSVLKKSDVVAAIAEMLIIVHCLAETLEPVF